MRRTERNKDSDGMKNASSGGYKKRRGSRHPQRVRQAVGGARLPARDFLFGLAIALGVEVSYEMPKQNDAKR